MGEVPLYTSTRNRFCPGADLLVDAGVSLRILVYLVIYDSG